MKPTDKWLKVAEEYRIHAKDWENCCTFTEEDAEAQFMSETYGHEHYFPYTRRNANGKYNGYAVGKHWQGVMEAYYRQDVGNGDFCKAEYAQVELMVRPDRKFDIVLNYPHSEEVFSCIEAPTWFPHRITEGD